MSLSFIDTYHGNPDSLVNGALAVSDAGIFKASEGAKSNDDAHDARVAMARHAGKAIGHYHFGWLGLDVHQQVQHFLAAAKWQRGDVMVLDSERYRDPVPAGQWNDNPAERLAWDLEFLAGVNQGAPGVHTWLYVNRSELGALRTAAGGRLAEFDVQPKWIADPNHPAGHPGIGVPWVAHQFSSAGGIDRDVFAGDLAAWHGYGGLVAAPAPHPAALPVCRLSELVNAAHRDPARPQGGTTQAASDDVLLVEHALADLHLLDPHYADGSFGSLTVAGYSKWQHLLGYSGQAADGIPGLKSLTALGQDRSVRQKFTAVA